MAARQTSRPQREYDTDREATVDFDVDENNLLVTATISKTLSIEQLFSECPDDDVADARLKTVDDAGHGWAGFEIRDGQLYRVNWGAHAADGGEYLDVEPVDSTDVSEKILEIVEDRDVGTGYGDFAPRRPGAGL